MSEISVRELRSTIGRAQVAPPGAGLGGFPEFLKPYHSCGRRQRLVTRLIFVKF